VTLIPDVANLFNHPCTHAIGGNIHFIAVKWNGTVIDFDTCNVDKQTNHHTFLTNALVDERIGRWNIDKGYKKS
jgi:hypothetical protein